MRGRGRGEREREVGRTEDADVERGEGGGEGGVCGWVCGCARKVDGVRLDGDAVFLGCYEEGLVGAFG